MTAKIVVVMNTDAFKDAEDALFEGNAGDELARILRRVARFVSGRGVQSLTYTGWDLQDTDGQTVGQMTITED